MVIDLLFCLLVLDLLFCLLTFYHSATKSFAFAPNIEDAVTYLK